jgi:hypothetical protein
MPYIFYNTEELLQEESSSDSDTQSPTRERWLVIGKKQQAQSPTSK